MQTSCKARVYWKESDPVFLSAEKHLWFTFISTSKVVPGSTMKTLNWSHGRPCVHQCSIKTNTDVRKRLSTPCAAISPSDAGKTQLERNINLWERTAGLWRDWQKERAWSENLTELENTLLWLLTNADSHRLITSHSRQLHLGASALIAQPMSRSGF